MTAREVTYRDVIDALHEAGEADVQSIDPQNISGPLADVLRKFRLVDRPGTWEVCDACNYDRHRCYFCDADLSHAEACYKGCPHGCEQDE